MGVSRPYLLDTHAVLWALTDPDRLGPAAGAVLRDPRSVLLVSAATTWEIATKHRLGTLPHADALLATYDRHLDRLGAQPLAITDAHALLAGQVQWSHRDPFDRMLAAQSMLEEATLVTADAAFATLPGLRLLW